MESLPRLLLKKFDILLIAAVVALIFISISTIQSTIIASKAESVILTTQLLNVQLLSVSGGLLFFVVAVLLNYRYFSYGAAVLYCAVLAGLIGVLFVGQNIRGSIRWYDLGFFSLQPSVVSIVLLTICFAAYFNAVSERINEVKYLFGALIMLAMPVVLILIEPDLGSTIVLCGVWAAQLMMSPIKISRLLVFGLCIAVLFPFGWQQLESYQRDRLTAFIDPTHDPLGIGYHINQSVIAVGSGEMSGRGWGRGTQSHLQFLPEQHTDFIFATFAEEQGFRGSVILVWLYILILWRLYVITKNVEGLFGQLLVVGIWVWLALHAFVNIAMNIGMAPITGIPLPFVSYGGTAMLTSLLAMGIVSSVRFHQYSFSKTPTSTFNIEKSAIA